MLHGVFWQLLAFSFRLLQFVVALTRSLESLNEIFAAKSIISISQRREGLATC